MPQIATHIFNRKKLNSTLNNIAIEDLCGETSAKEINKIIQNWQSLARRGVLDKKSEISLHDAFLKGFFGKVLQYMGMAESPEEWHFEREKSTKSDATRSDAALGFFTGESRDDVRVAVELKSAKTNLDQKQARKGSNYTPVEQAFMYANKFGKACKWVIVSNYRETRLYRSNSMNEYEVFFIENLDKEEELKKFLYLLYRKKLINKDAESPTDKLYRISEAEQEQISEHFYKQYKEVRYHLFEHLKQKNPGVDELILVEKTQKILDRFIFVCFCEDTGLLPERIFRKVLEAVKSNGLMIKICAWDQIKGLFQSINEGNPAYNINRYDGGLFAHDELLDDQLVLDDVIINELSEIADYDFDSDLNVNILGHIFEQSIADIEELKAWISGEQKDIKKGKRKKEGIYYTPEYITRYIVEQALGSWLNDKKIGLGFDNLPGLTDEDYDSIKSLKTRTAIRYNKNVKKHIEFWEAYKRILSYIKVLDPACGSGAFLNQAFDYLYKEGQEVNRQITELKKGQMDIFGLDKHILRKNLYGVDLNPESVEITKLSLWLKTANPKSELTALDDNILCGNSLIDDPEVAGEVAFNWNKNFSDIMENGGFDVVIGNPPYTYRNAILEKEKKYFRQNYLSTEGNYDLYKFFVEKTSSLVGDQNYVSLIIPNTFLTSQTYKKLRKLILRNFSVIELFDLGENIFENVVVENVIFLFKKANKKSKETKIKIQRDRKRNFHDFEKEYFINLEDPDFKEESTFNIYLSPEVKPIIKKIKTDVVFLKDIAYCTVGINTGYIKSELTARYQKDERYHKMISGRDIGRNTVDWKNEWIMYDSDFVKSFGKKGRTLPPEYVFTEPKILVQRTRRGMKRKLICYYDKSGFYNLNRLSNVVLTDPSFDIKYILVLLNSAVDPFNWTT